MTRKVFVLLLLGGCWEANPNYRQPPGEVDLRLPAPDLPSPDMIMCPSYPAGGGGGKGRPEVLVKGGRYEIQGVQFDVASFYLDVFEVTVKAYRECVAGGVCSKPDTGGSCNWTDTAMQKEDHPINCVDWMQAAQFCDKWAGRRLPTEGEWEYAAAGAMKSTYPWGAEEPQRGDQGRLCWDRYDKMLGTCPVGSYEKTLLGGPTCLGVADLAGNVWEWTNTEYKSPYASPETTCKQTSSSCSLRGGSWGSFDSSSVRAAYRIGLTPSLRGNYVGFRCARTG